MLPHFGKSFLRMHLLSKMLQRDMINHFNRSLATMDMLQNNHNHEFPQVNDNAYYKKTVTVNDNGNIIVKTMTKEPGKDWSVVVEEHHNTNKGPAVEQDKGAQKKPESLEQSKTDKVEAKSEAQPKSQEKPKLEKATIREQENVTRDNAKATSEASSKPEPQKIEKPNQQKVAESKEGKEGKISSPSERPLRRYYNPFDEFNSVFERMENEFEESFSDHFGRSRYDVAPRYRHPFDEMDAVFSRMERDFENSFRRSFDFYDPFFDRRSRFEQARRNDGSEKEGSKNHTPQQEESAALNK